MKHMTLLFALLTILPLTACQKENIEIPPGQCHDRQLISYFTSLGDDELLAVAQGYLNNENQSAVGFCTGSHVGTEWYLYSAGVQFAHLKTATQAATRLREQAQNCKCGL
jgi:hypothetical protein